MTPTDWQNITNLNAREFCEKHEIKYGRLIKDLKRGHCCLSPHCNSKHDLKNVYMAIRDRCYNERCNHYKNYGGRGIRMSGEFLYSFDAFIKYMGEKPGPEYSIDRIDNDGNYERGNLRWATRTQQNANKRPQANSAVGYKNITKIKKNKFRVRINRHYKKIECGCYESLNNAIATREIMTYRIDNGMYS